MTERRITAEEKRNVVRRAGGCCEYCRSQQRFGTEPFSAEHIDPRSQGGKTVLENLALSCQGCNNHKFTKTESHDPVTGEAVPLYHPRKQRWEDHFAWSVDFTEVVGLTPIGRATVVALHLNREGLMNLRRVLYAVGEHPPPESPGETSQDVGMPKE